MEVEKCFDIDIIDGFVFGPVLHRQAPDWNREGVNEKFPYLSLFRTVEYECKIEACITVECNSTFQGASSCDCPDLGREKGKWFCYFLPLAKMWNGF